MNIKVNDKRIRWTVESIQNHIKPHFDRLNVVSLGRNQDSKVIVTLQCENDSHAADECSLDNLLYHMSSNKTNRTICRDCYLADVENEFTQFQLHPLDLYRFENTRSNITCIDSDGYKVVANLSRLRTGKKPNPFQSNPFALDNVQHLVSKYDIYLTPGQSYDSIDSPYFGTKDGYIVRFRIGEVKKGSLPSPFHSSNEFALNNVQELCNKLGTNIELIPNQQYVNSNVPLLGRNRDGYTVLVKIYDLMDGKMPSAFHSSNPYSISNLQLLCDKKEIGIVVLENQAYKDSSSPICGINKDGYKVHITLDGLKAGKDPSPFHPNNPYTCENIQLFCHKHCNQIELKPNQSYKNAKEKLVFVHKDTKIEFETTWSNLQRDYEKLKTDIKTKRP